MALGLPWGWPASRTRHQIEVPGVDVHLPATLVVGAQEGPTLLVSGGVHGGEYPGIEAAWRFARDLDPTMLRGRVVVIHLTNPPPFWAKMQYVSPLDGINLNRVFPGSSEGSACERIAHVVMSIATESDAWVDLHGGDIHEALVPFTIYSDRGDAAMQARAMAEAYGIPRLLASDSVAGSTYAAAAQAGIPAILAEAGECGQLDEAAVITHLEGLRNILRLVGCLDEPLHATPPTVTYRSFVWSRATQRGLWHRAAGAGDQVVEGQLVGVLTDEYGDVLDEVTAPRSGEVVFIATSMAIGEGDPLFSVTAV